MMHYDKHVGKVEIMSVMPKNAQKCLVGMDWICLNIINSKLNKKAETFAHFKNNKGSLRKLYENKNY